MMPSSPVADDALAVALSRPAQLDFLRGKLLEAKRAGRRYRLRTSVPPFAIGSLMLATGTFQIGYWWSVGRVEDTLFTHASATFASVGLPIFFLGMRPSDRVTIAVVIVTIAVAGPLIASARQLSRGLQRFGAVQAQTCGGVYTMFLLALGLTPIAVWCALGVYLLAGLAGAHASGPRGGGDAAAAAQRVTMRGLLERLWDGIGATYLALALNQSFNVIMLHLVWPSFPVAEEMGQLWLVRIGALIVVGTACLVPRVRERVLGCLVSRSPAVAAAAGIGTLMGGCEVDELVRDATRRFRAVRFDQLEPTVFSAADADAERAMYARTIPAELGGIDAFVTHSTQDPPAHKWAQLQAWRDRFFAENGREPTLWIDRHCLLPADDNSNASAEDILCLPVYIAGCERLLMLLGPTFAQRLWCVVELVTHEYVGGGARRIDGCLLPGFSPDSLDAFDVAQTSCFWELDRQWLLSCVEVTAGHSDRAAFNEAIRGTLRRVASTALGAATAELAGGAPEGGLERAASGGTPHGVASAGAEAAAPRPPPQVPPRAVPPPSPPAVDSDDVTAGLEPAHAVVHVPFTWRGAPPPPPSAAAPRRARVVPAIEEAHPPRHAAAGASKLGAPRTRRLRAMCAAYALWSVLLVAACLGLTARGQRACRACARFLDALPRDERGWHVYEGRGGRAAYALLGDNTAARGPPLVAGDAAAACAAHDGAFLSSIGDEAEHKLHECLAGFFVGQVLIGLFQSPGAEEPAGGWEWADARLKGSAYRRWRRGHPDNRVFVGYPHIDCAVVQTGTWVDHPCHDWEARYVCKRYLDGGA